MARKKNTCYILETVQLRPKKKKDINCYILEIVQLIPLLKKQLIRTGNSRTDTRVVVFLVHF